MEPCSCPRCQAAAAEPAQSAQAAAGPEATPSAAGGSQVLTPRGGGSRPAGAWHAHRVHPVARTTAFDLSLTALLLLPVCADGAGGAPQEQSPAYTLLLALAGGILAVLLTGPLLHTLHSMLQSMRGAMLQTAGDFLGSESHINSQGRGPAACVCLNCHHCGCSLSSHILLCAALCCTHLPCCWLS